jgi:hypothetical protein
MGMLSLAVWRVLSISLQMRNLAHYIFKLPSDCREAQEVHVGKRALGRNTANCVLLGIGETHVQDAVDMVQSIPTYASDYLPVVFTRRQVTSWIPFP